MKPEAKFFDPDDVVTNYEETDWFGIISVIVVAALPAWIIIRIIIGV